MECLTDCHELQKLEFFFSIEPLFYMDLTRHCLKNNLDLHAIGIHIHLAGSRASKVVADDNRV